MSRPNVLPKQDTANDVVSVSVVMDADEAAAQRDRVETLIWILRRKYCSLNSFKFSDSVRIYRDKEKRLTMLILLAASVTSSFSLGTMSTQAAMVKYIGVGISLLTTIVSGVQKVKNYPDQVDKGTKLAEDWRKIANTVNIRLNKMDEPTAAHLISEDDAVSIIGDLKCQNINFTCPVTEAITERGRDIKWATKLLDSCVALKISGDCSLEKVNLLNAKVQRLLDPPPQEGDPDFEV